MPNGARWNTRLDAADLAVLDLEQLAELPGPVDVVVVEEREGEHDAALAVHRHEAAVTDARHDALQRSSNCFLQAPGTGCAVGCRAVVIMPFS